MYPIGGPLFVASNVSSDDRARAASALAEISKALEGEER